MNKTIEDSHISTHNLNKATFNRAQTVMSASLHLKATLSFMKETWGVNDSLSKESNSLRA